MHSMKFSGSFGTHLSKNSLNSFTCKRSLINSSNAEKKIVPSSKTAIKVKSLLDSCTKDKILSDEDWYATDPEKLFGVKDTRLINRYYGNIYTALSTFYPEKEWTPWKFKHANAPSGFWEDRANQRKFFDDLGKKIGIKHLDDWYSFLSKELIAEHGGASIVALHSSSMEALIANYPEHKWIPWKFRHVSRSFWTLENQRAFFDWLGQQLGVQQLDDWYSKISHKTILKYGGGFISKHYKSSPAEALMAVYPEHEWLPWKFTVASHGFWKGTSNLRKFFDWLGKQLGVKELDDWYKHLSVDAVVKHGAGSALIMHHGGSPSAALIAAYPEHKWIPWKFERCIVPKFYWDSEKNTTNFIHELSERLCIQSLDDWYRVDAKQLVQFGAMHVFKRHGGLYKLLKKEYPHHPWDPRKFSLGKKAQRWLLVNIKKLYPNEEIIEDYMHPKAIFKSSKRPIQLDAFLPARSLAFEYQGNQHFTDVSVFQPKQVYQQRDQEKRAACAENNITLIEIPYWWDRTQKGLEDMIKQQLAEKKQQMEGLTN